MSDYPKDWEEVELTNIANTFIGLVTTMTSNYTNDGAKLIRNQDIQNNKFIFKENIYLNRKFAELNKSRMHKLGDVVTVHTGDIGTSAVIEESLVGSLGFATIVTRLDKKIADPYFISCYFNSKYYKDYVMSIMTGDGRNNLNMKDFNKTRLMLPPLPEQKAIANTLMTFDKHIENLEKLIEKKKMIRDGAVEDLMTGKTRLDGFDGEWEEKKIGDILKIMHGKNQHSVESSTGEYPILGTGGIIGKSVDYLCDWECVCIGRKGTIDKPLYVDYPFWSIDTLYYSKPLNENNVKFQYYLFTTIKWLDYAESSGRPSLSKDEIESIDITIPTDIKEQQAIASILTSMDEEIQDLEKEKEKIEKIKAGAMDDLLTGKVRLI